MVGVVGVLALTVTTLLLVYNDAPATGSASGVGTPVASVQLASASGSLASLDAVRLTAAGDLGGRNNRAGKTLNLLVSLAPVAHLALGDMSYSDIEPESAWCDWVINGDGSAGVSGVGSIPVQLVGGNHEEDNSPDGFIRDFAACLPDRFGSIGDYGVEYYTDIGGLVRVVMIAADITVDGEYYDYGSGPHRAWLEQAVNGARLQGIPWVVVGMHKVCVTTGTKSCEVGESLMDWLLAPGRADLVLQGHDHGVQRSHQLRCVDVDTSTPGCLVDTDGSHSQGDGGVILVGGTFGRSARSHDSSDSEAGYFASVLSDQSSSSDEQQGVWQLDFTPTSLSGRWVGSTSAYTDEFLISSAPSASPSPPADEPPSASPSPPADEPPLTEHEEAFSPPCTIVGTPGPDVLVGTGGDDHICGLGGDDRLYGMGGNDILLAGGGNDTLFGQGGADTLRGGTGRDTLYGGASNDRLYGGEGGDVLFGRGGADVLKGGPGNDRLYGQSGRDVLYGRDGNDRLVGGSHGDRLFGQSGWDTLYGGRGNDMLVGGIGDDTLYGQSGRDRLSGGMGRDFLSGGPSYDKLNGGPDADTAKAPGPDFLFSIEFIVP